MGSNVMRITIFDLTGSWLGVVSLFVWAHLLIHVAQAAEMYYSRSIWFSYLKRKLYTEIGSEAMKIQGDKLPKYLQTNVIQYENVLKRHNKAISTIDKTMKSKQ